MAKSISVAEAKNRFSELVNRVSYGHERYLVERRGKPVVAIVSAGDLARLENGEVGSSGGGLLSAVGLLADVEEWDEIIEDIMRQRSQRLDTREVDLG
jgi:prevent-host-death family protein